MSVFNGFLPAEAPIEFAGGSADLTADIVLQRDDADGWVKLMSKGVKIMADGQSASGDLDVDIRLVDGVPRDMFFDISGSRLSLKNVQIPGEADQFDDEAWTASRSKVAMG